MGALVMVLGKSGAGKSTSLRNFKDGEIGLFNVAGKPLPFPDKISMVNHARYDRIREKMAANKCRAYVIDDATYLMAFQNFERAGEKGYDKFVEMAQAFYRLLQAASMTDDDTIVYFMLHPELDANGNEKIRTIGKMLDEKLCIEGLFPVVIGCEVQDGRHVFNTVNNGSNLAKAPMGALPEVMDNDLKEVDTMLRKYWSMKPLVDEQPAGGGEDA